VCLIGGGCTLFFSVSPGKGQQRSYLYVEPGDAAYGIASR
jgi:hypothetical protein